MAHAERGPERVRNAKKLVRIVGERTRKTAKFVCAVGGRGSIPSW